MSDLAGLIERVREAKGDLRSPAGFARWRAEYHPCETGVSIFQPEGGEFGGLTLRNFPGATLAPIMALSSAGEGDDFDLVCDLYVDGDLIDTLAIRRQDLAAVERALTPLQDTTHAK
jgi:hypothetical protein